MKLFFTLIVAACCAGLAVPDLALAKSRNSGRAHQSSGSDQANDDRPKSGHTAGSKLPRQTAGKSPSKAKPASRGKAKSRAGSRATRSAGSKPVQPDTVQEDIPAATRYNSTAPPRSEPTRNEQIRSTKELAKLYMHKAK